MRAAKTDKNQAELVAQLRAIGCSVQDLSGVGKGTPDILVGFRGVNLLFEIKTTVGKLNNRQIEWHGDWDGQATIIRSFEDAMIIIEQETL